jgi:AcrR family transcriptional regulator
MASPRTRRRTPRLPPEVRREQVLDAALGLISEHGYQAASMEAIARAMGITKPVVYDAFADRGALLRALLQREENRAMEALGAVLPSDLAGDPDELLVNGITAFLHAVIANPPTWRLILMPAGETPPVVRAHVEAGRATVYEQLHVLIRWGLERRTGLGDVDAELAARMLIAVGEQAARLALTDPEHYSPERFATFASTLLQALPQA